MMACVKSSWLAIVVGMHYWFVLKLTNNLIMEALPAELQDLNVLRRLFFAVGYLPEDFPKYCSILSAFLTQQSQGKPICETVLKIAMENLRYLSEESLVTDNQLAKEVHSLSFPSGSKNTVGIVLISHNDTSKKCGATLLQGDRPRTVYTETYGTVLQKVLQQFSQRVQFCKALWIQHRWKSFSII